MFLKTVTSALFLRYWRDNYDGKEAELIKLHTQLSWWWTLVEIPHQNSFLGSLWLSGFCCLLSSQVSQNQCLFLFSFPADIYFVVWGFSSSQVGCSNAVQFPTPGPTPTPLCCCTHTSPFCMYVHIQAPANDYRNRGNKNNKRGKISKYLIGWCSGFGLRASEVINEIPVGSLSLLWSTVALFFCSCSPDEAIGAFKAQVTSSFNLKSLPCSRLQPL